MSDRLMRHYGKGGFVSAYALALYLDSQISEDTYYGEYMLPVAQRF